jgi:hypothetical protein
MVARSYVGSDCDATSSHGRASASTTLNLLRHGEQRSVRRPLVVIVLDWMPWTAQRDHANAGIGSESNGHGKRYGTAAISGGTCLNR